MSGNATEKILRIHDLVIHYETDEEVVEAVNGVNIELERGKVLGLVGETGAGKTTTALGIMGLLPAKVGHVIQGEIQLEGEDLLDADELVVLGVQQNAAGVMASRRRIVIRTRNGIAVLFPLPFALVVSLAVDAVQKFLIKTHNTPSF